MSLRFPRSVAARLRLALPLLALCGGLSPAASAPRPMDMTTTAGFNATCAAMPRQTWFIRRDDERVAWAICHDVDLLRRAITWVTHDLRTLADRKTTEARLKAEVERRIDGLRTELRRSREQLERVRQQPGVLLRIAPGQWQIDLDGDGRISTWEAHFFAIPNRSTDEASPSMPSDDPDHYRQQTQLDAVIGVDASDVLWALSYHQFIEGLLANVRAFDVDIDRMRITLARPALLREAHRLIGQGLTTSEQLRESVLAETDDDQEWLGNPAQRSSRFPVPLEAADFATWGEVVQQMQALWQGRHLLPTTRGQRGLLAEMAPLCEPGQGLDLSRLYLEPAPKGTQATLEALRALGQRACRPVDAAHPLSELPAWMERTRSGQANGMQLLRYLYWVN